MSAVLEPLLLRLRESSEPALWIADENSSELPSALHAHPAVTLLSNRYDLAEAARSRGLSSYFSDFDLDQAFAQPTPNDSTSPAISAVFYRVSKERPVVNHIINSAYRLLPEGSKLYLAGQKNEGIKTYFAQAAKLFGSSSRLQKQGEVYSGELQKVQKVSKQAEPLDDRDYPNLRWIDVAGEIKFFSKPGTYGWNKVDKGSQFLVQQVKPLLDSLDTAPLRFLDLGCGYGYITLQCRYFGFAQMTATDNNAAALECMRANADHYQLPVTVVADDCASHLTGPYDLILCNPPFHQGFNVDSSLTDKFLQNTRRLMSSDSRAYFVVNAFIPLDSKARKLFAGPHEAVNTIANNGQFKIVEIRRGELQQSTHQS